MWEATQVAHREAFDDLVQAVGNAESTDDQSMSEEYVIYGRFVRKYYIKRWFCLYQLNFNADDKQRMNILALSIMRSMI